MAMLTRYGIPALLFVGLAALVYVWFSASSTQEPATGLKALAKGEMRDLQFRSSPPVQSVSAFLDPADESVTLADFHGEIVVLNFWGTFCAPCITEMPTLADLQSQYEGQNLNVLAVSVDRVGDFPEARKQLAELTDGRLDFYSDPTHGLLFDSSVGGFPTTLIYDARGREIARFEGEADWMSEDAITFFDALLARQAQSEPTT